MEIREAVEADAERMAAIADSPPDVMRNLVHDRTVRVATGDESADGSADDERGGAGDADETGDGDGDEAAADDALVGLVSFDARGDTVHVTQIAGTRAACERLLEEPVRFARGEGMAVELLVPASDDVVQAAVESRGFKSRGSGPQFDGRPTTRYRLDPGKAEQ